MTDKLTLHEGNVSPEVAEAYDDALQRIREDTAMLQRLDAELGATGGLVLQEYERIDRIRELRRDDGLRNRLRSLTRVVRKIVRRYERENLDDADIAVAKTAADRLGIYELSRSAAIEQEAGDGE